MRSEEAIEYLKNLIKNPTISQDPFYTTKIAIDTVLILIEEYNKQLDLDYVDNNFVSKDVIRDKIKEWDKSIKWNNADDRYFAIKILKELLGDKK